MSNNKKILLCVTGSAAFVKIPLLVEKLQSDIENCEIKVVITRNAERLFEKMDFFNVLKVEVIKDGQEWEDWSKMGDPILHINLVKWADLLLLAPMNANTLAKVANGICDNLLTCVARAWEPQNPFLFCPSMNTSMLMHPITSQQIGTLKSWGYTEIPPVCKTLACGVEGNGAMSEVETIVPIVKETLKG